MPDETHNFLINYETTAARATAEMQQISRAFQDQIEQVERLTQGHQRLTQAAEESTRALVRRRGPMQRGIQTVFTGGVGGEVGVSPEELFVQREYMRTTRNQEALAAFQRSQTFEGRMAERLEAKGIFQEHQIRIAERYREVLEESLSPQDAFARAQREIAKELQGTGEAAQKSGHWLGGYIQRYLIRYIAVWQLMRVAQDVMRDTSEAQREMRETTFQLGVAMQGTGQEAQQYLQAMAAIASQTTVAPSAAAGGVLLGGRVGTMAMQLAQITGADPTQWVQHLVMLRDEYGMTADAIEGSLDRIIAAYARLALQGKSYFGEGWQQGWRETGGQAGGFEAALTTAPGPSFGEMWTRGIQMPMLRELQRQTFMQRPQEERAELQRQYAEEMDWPERRMRVQAPAQQADFYRWMAEREGGGAGIGGEGGTAMGLQNYLGVMSERDYQRMQELVTGFDDSMANLGITMARNVERDVIIQAEAGLQRREMVGSLEAIAFATQEMNERQKSAVYNWPGDAPLIIMPGAMDQVSAPRPSPVLNPQPIYDIYLPMIWKQYQHGTNEVRETGPAIVHKGERVIPAGGAAMTGSLNLQSNLYVNGRLVARDVSRIQGDQLLQAQRASGGQIGAFV